MNGGVEALGDGVADEGGALFLQQLDLPLLLLHQRIDPRRLPIQEGGDGALFFSAGGISAGQVPDEVPLALGIFAP